MEGFRCRSFMVNYVDNKIKNYDNIINQISEIRKINNENWMNILRLCFISNPIEAKKIFKNITDNDKAINKLSRSLCK
jgi:hypothetical protein